MRGAGLKKAAALALGCVLALGLAACESTLTTYDASAYVRGVLDETYKGSWDAVFLGQVDSTEDEAQKAYDEAIGQEYERFCYQFDLRDERLTDETREEITGFLKELCAKASYSVKSAVALDDTRYAVEVSVRPMDLFLQVKEDSLAAFQKEFEGRFTHTDPAAMEPSARERFWESYENAWARGVLELCTEKMGVLGYLDVQPILVLVAPDEEGLYGMEDNDFSNLSALILPY